MREENTLLKFAFFLRINSATKTNYWHLLANLRTFSLREEREIEGEAQQQKNNKNNTSIC